MSRSEHSNTTSSKSPLCEFEPTQCTLIATSTQCTLIATSNTQDHAPYTPHPVQYAVIHVFLSMRRNSVSTPYIQFEMPSINHTPGGCGFRLPWHSYGGLACPAYIERYPNIQYIRYVYVMICIYKSCVRNIGCIYVMYIYTQYMCPKYRMYICHDLYIASIYVRYVRYVCVKSDMYVSYPICMCHIRYVCVIPDMYVSYPICMCHTRYVCVISDMYVSYPICMCRICICHDL